MYRWPRFGYRRLWAMLRREKNPDGTRRWVGNHKRVHRLYREGGLAMRRKTQKRLRAQARVPLLPRLAFAMAYDGEAATGATVQGQGTLVYTTIDQVFARYANLRGWHLSLGVVAR